VVSDESGVDRCRHLKPQLGFAKVITAQQVLLFQKLVNGHDMIVTPDCLSFHSLLASCTCKDANSMGMS
jgi:hypothetical protein